MAEHPNAEPIRRSFEAFAKGDMAGMKAMVAEDTVWHIPGRGPLAGDHQGRDAVFEMFGRLVQASEEPSLNSFRMQPPVMIMHSH